VLQEEHAIVVASPHFEQNFSRNSGDWSAEAVDTWPLGQTSATRYPSISSYSLEDTGDPRPPVHILTLTVGARAARNLTNAWDTYRNHLNTTVPPSDPGAAGAWNGTSNTLFANLLVALAIDVGFRFDRDQLSKGAYSVPFMVDLLQWT